MTKSKFIKINGQSIYKIGNKKIGFDTIIFNITSAHKCPNRNTCPYGIDGTCYGLKCEKIFKQSIPFKDRQTKYWDNNKIEDIADDIISIICTNPQIRYIRFNETGDIRGQMDYKKINFIAHMVKDYHVQVYIYTHSHKVMRNIIRKEYYDMYKAPNLTINGSDTKMYDNKFIVTDEIKQNKLMCNGNCRDCDLCKYSGHKEIYVLKH